MTTTIEQVALAMFESEVGLRVGCADSDVNAVRYGNRESWQNTKEYYRVLMRRQSRAAVEALRELDTKMQAALGEVYANSVLQHFEYPSDAGLFVWRTMIDHILEEK